MVIMQPSSNELSGHNMPTPAAEQSMVVGAPFETINQPLEATVAAHELDPTRSRQVVAAMPTMSLPSVAPVIKVPNVNDVTKTTSPVVPATADDGDLIEKEWVNKAKKIVNSTREDPYAQSRELTLFKADYLQKRYNKIIKLTE